MAETAEMHFGDRLMSRVRQLGNPLCIGLDPHCDRIPPLFRNGPMTPGDRRTAPAIEAFLKEVLDRSAGRVAVVKPQSAFFELLGWRGMRLLETVVRHASNRGFLVINDAKRGDIGTTAEAYARAYLHRGGPLACDALTISPFLGQDSIAPYIVAARGNGSGVFALVKTSNPGSGEYQDLILERRTEVTTPVSISAGGEDRAVRFFEHVARSLATSIDALRGPATGWSSLGIVVGATYPHQADLLRSILPNALFLVPGYGAQGGGAAAAIRSFVPGPAGPEGGIVNSSRAVLFPADGETDTARAWERAFDVALEVAIEGLVAALAVPR